jgi:hypothetical protein
MEAYFKIFDLPIRIESESQRFLHDFGNILHYFRAKTLKPGLNNGLSFCVSINRTSTIACGNDIIYRSPDYRYILEYLEYKIYTLVIDRLSNYYLIHAGVVTHNDRAILLPASSGGGKTTLIAGLLKDSFRYLTDEIGVIDPHTFKVHPFPKPLNIKTGSVSLFEDFGPEMEVIKKNEINIEDKIHHVLVKRSSIHAMDTPLPVGDIIFVEYDPRGKSRLAPISRANAIFEMAKCSFNQYRFKGKGIDILDGLVRGCECYELKFTEIGKGVNLIRERFGVTS